MVLSEAIRRGARLHPQARNIARVVGPHGEIIATCAMGAAEVAGFPVPQYPFERVFRQIIALNDASGWTRERIADWLDATYGAPYGLKGEVVASVAPMVAAPTPPVVPAPRVRELALV